MTLPASGNISLNDITVEYGYPSGSKISMYDARVQYLAGNANNANLQVSMSSLQGKTANCTHVVAGGYFGPNGFYGVLNLGTTNTGAIFPPNTQSATFGSANTRQLDYYYDTGYVIFNMDLIGGTNQGFTSIKIGNTTFNRVDATFSNAIYVQWAWSPVATNPFTSLANGVYTPVTFTY